MAESVCLEVAVEAGLDGHDVAVRSAGLSPTAVRRLTTRDLAWADLVAVMEEVHRDHIGRVWPDHAAKVRVLGVPDLYAPGEPDLRAALLPKLRALLDELTGG